MDQQREIPFPNPIARHDLVKPRRWFKPIAIGFVVVLLLATALMPQILSSRIGRKLVKVYLESKYRGTVWVADISTSWTGPTNIVGFSFTDPEGRQFRFKQLQCEMSAWDLVTGNLDLGKATLDELVAEYVLDYGDGTDTIDRLDADFTPGRTASRDAPVVGQPKPPLLNLPALSGEITLSNATLTVTRGHIQEDRQFRSVFRSARFGRINGTLQIASLDQPFKVQLVSQFQEQSAKPAKVEEPKAPEPARVVDPSARAAETPKEAAPTAAIIEDGTLSIAGTLDLGENRKLDPEEFYADIKLSARNMPHAAGAASYSASGPLGWVFFPMLPAEDVAELFGPTLESLDMNLKAQDGLLHLENIKLVGQKRPEGAGGLEGSAAIDLVSTPRAIKIDSPLTLRGNLTPEFAYGLASVNPFLEDATDGGQVTLTIRKLHLPLAGHRDKVQAEGTLSIANGRLASGMVSTTDRRPRELATQFQMVIGHSDPTIPFAIPEAKFAIAGNRTTAEPHTAVFAGHSIQMEGKSDGAGRIAHELALETPQSLRSAGHQGERIDLSLSGMLDRPELNLAELAKAPGVRDALDHNLVLLSQRQRDALLHLSSKKVDSLLEPFNRPLGE